MTFIVTTAFPPSTNQLFKNRKGGRAVTERYRYWRQAAGHDYRMAQLARNNPPPLTCPVCVSIELVRPDKRRRDLDNFCKALIDQAVEHRVIEDDRQVVDMRVRWVERPFVGARLIIWPIEDSERAAA